MKRLTLLLVPLCPAAAGCAGSALRPDDTQQQEIQALKARILELQRETAMSQVEVAQLRQQVAELEARNGGAPRPAAPPSTLRSAPPPSPPPKSSAVREDPRMAPRPVAAGQSPPAPAERGGGGPQEAPPARGGAPVHPRPGAPDPPGRAGTPGHPAGRADR